MNVASEYPGPVTTQVTALVEAFEVILAENLVGIYLHGSLAMGCFNPKRSDVDLLVVNRRRMRAKTRRQVAELLLLHSGAPAPVEISILTLCDLRPWRFPPPFDLHFSEEWREQIERELSDGRWRRWAHPEQRSTDADLAAHITLTRSRGRCLVGPAIDQVFPAVPSPDFRAAIVGDLAWARERLAENPVYAVLNVARVLWYVREGKIGSKVEAGVWASQILPNDLGMVVATALSAYRSEEAEAIDLREAERLMGLVLESARYTGELDDADRGWRDPTRIEFLLDAPDRPD